MKQLFLILSLALLLLAGCGESPTTQQAPTATEAPMSTPTSAQAVHYPPATADDLHGLAAKGDKSAIHEFHSEIVGLAGVCPQPKREVTVDPALIGQQLAEDLLAYFYAQHLDNSCGSLVVVYHNRSEAGGGYTAGRVDLTVTESKHRLTLDTGGLSTSEEYIISY